MKYAGQGGFACALGATAFITIVALLTSCTGALSRSLEAERCFESYARGSADLVIDDCTRAIQSGHLTPTELVDSYSIRAVGWRAKDNLDQAIADDSEAIRLNPKYYEAYAGRGYSWYEKGDKAKATHDFDDAIALAPNEPLNYAARGYLRFDLGDFAGAVSDLQRAAQQLRDPHPVLWLFLARSRLGQDGAAELAANAVRAKTHPWSPAVIELFLGQRTPDSIPADVQSGNDGCNVPFYVGEWQLKRGDSAAAIASLRRTVATCPKSYVAYRGAVAELTRLGDPPQ